MGDVCQELKLLGIMGVQGPTDSTDQNLTVVILPTSSPPLRSSALTCPLSSPPSLPRTANS
jgi:hypothetical protein